MPQKLIYPINNLKITAGYKNPAYKERFGFTHHGQDMISTGADRAVYSSGNGTVIATGLDNVFGNVIIVAYTDVLNSVKNKSADIILRYFHLDSVVVKSGQLVSVQTKLGVYGNTGKYSAGAHLHVEADYDTIYPAFSATLGKSSNIIKAGKDSTMVNPSEIFYLSNSLHNKQSCTLSTSSHNNHPFVLPTDAYFNNAD